MNNKAKLIIVIIVFAAVLVGAFFGYRALSEKYGRQSEAASGVTPSPEAEPSQPAAESTETSSESEEDRYADLDEAPDFRMLNSDMEEMSLSDLYGKPIVINFWASWCPPCKRELPIFQEAYDEYGDRVNFVMLDLADGSRETIDAGEEYVASQGFDFPLYFDFLVEGALAYGTFSIPVTVVITENGKFYTQRVGGIPTRDILDEMVLPLLEDAG